MTIVETLVDIDGITLPDVDQLVNELVTKAETAPSFQDPTIHDWKIVHQETKPVNICVYRSANKEQFKTLVEFPYPIEEIIGFCTNVLNRPTWDDFCIEAKILHEIDEFTQIHYTCSRGFLTVSGRDLVNIFHKRPLENDKKWVTCARSIETSAVPEYPGRVRAYARLIGILFERHPENPEQCRFIHLSDLDSKMTLPSFFLAFLAGKAIPNGMKNLNKALQKAIEENKKKSDEKS